MTRWRSAGAPAGGSPRRARTGRSPAARPPLRRWAFAGAACGLLAGMLAFAPAAWLARAVAGATEGRVLLAEPRGTLWTGDAVAVLTGGDGSRSAAALPGRLQWTLRWRDGAFELGLRHACCLRGTPALRATPGWGRLQVALHAADGSGGVIGQWPAAWLAGLGTPWNTLQLGGELRLASDSLRFDRRQGQWLTHGSARLELAAIASRLSTLPALGSYRLQIDAAAAGSRTLALVLTTDEGPLQLDANGQWAASGVRLRGEARAAPGAEAALDHLLNIIGRRQGERSLIAIG